MTGWNSRDIIICDEGRIHIAQHVIGFNANSIHKGLSTVDVA